MDIQNINDVDKLKSLAFDAIQAIEIQQQNLRIIQARLEEVNKSADVIPDVEPEVLDKS